MVEDNGYQQLLSSYTTAYKTLIDHVYTNTPNGVSCGVFETYFTDHKIVWVLFN